MTIRRAIAAVIAVACLDLLAPPLRAQVGKGLVDPNIAAESELQTLPHMTSAIVKDLVAKRPFMSVLELNTFLLGAKLTPELGDKARVSGEPRYEARCRGAM